MLGASDRSVHQAVLAEDFVVVTENHDDYLSLARGEEVHPGLILLASPGGPLQLAAFHAAVDHIEREAAAAAEAPEVLADQSLGRLHRTVPVHARLDVRGSAYAVIAACTAAAHLRPSAIAVTTRSAPRTASPQAKIPGVAVAYVPSTSTVPRSPIAAPDWA